MSEAGTRYSVETGRSGLTYEDFCALPDDGLRYEIVDGMLFAEPSPRRAHQKAVGNLFAILHAWVRAHDLGEVYVAPFDVILDPRTTVEPDLVFVVKDRLAIVAERGVEAAPDLLVEVLSPGTARRDRVRKLNARNYFRVHFSALHPPFESGNHPILSMEFPVRGAPDGGIGTETSPDRTVSYRRNFLKLTARFSTNAFRRSIASSV